MDNNEDWTEERDDTINKKEAVRRTIIIAAAAFLLGSAMGRNKGRADTYDNILAERKRYHIN